MVLSVVLSPLLLGVGCSSSPDPSLGESLLSASVHHCSSENSVDARVIPPFERVWGEKMGGRLVEGMTLAAGRLYTTSLNRRCGAYDDETGRTIWRKKLPDQPLGAPEVGGGRVWVVVGPRSPQLLCFHFATGDGLGSWPIPVPLGSPLFQDSLLVIATLQGQIMALRWDRLQDVSSADPLPVAWGRRVRGGLRTRPLAVQDTLLLVGTLADSLLAFDLRTGDPVWQIGVSGPVYGLTRAEDGVVVTLYNGTVLEADPSDGRVLWSSDLEGPFLLPAAAGGGLVVTVSTGGVVTALDPETGVNWTASLQQSVEAPPVLTAEHVILGTRRGSLVGLQRQKGTRDWSLDFQGPMTVSPCASSERILVADGRGEVRAFSHAGSRPYPPAPNGDRREEMVPTAASSDADTASVSISSEPEGLGVLLDDRFVGWTPLDSLLVASGFHRVVLRDSAGLLAHEALAEDWFRIDSGEHASIVLSPKKTIRLESVPPGATVSSGSEYLGTAPILAPRRPGSLLRLRHPGYRDTLVAVDHIESSRVLVRLKPVGKGLAHVATSPTREGKPWYTRDWVRWGAPLLTLASGAAAVLLRQEANDAYDDYLRTGETRSRDRYLSRAERLDRQSILSWVAAEVFFGFSFYSWIRSDEETEKSSDLPGPMARRGEREFP